MVYVEWVCFQRTNIREISQQSAEMTQSKHYNAEEAPSNPHTLYAVSSCSVLYAIECCVSTGFISPTDFIRSFKLRQNIIFFGFRHNFYANIMYDTSKTGNITLAIPLTHCAVLLSILFVWIFLFRSFRCCVFFLFFFSLLRGVHVHVRSPRGDYSYDTRGME